MQTLQPHLDAIAGQLPFMRTELIALAEQNSGSLNAAGVHAVASRVNALFAPLAHSSELLELAPFHTTADDGSRRAHTLGPALRIRRHPDAPLRVLLCGHLDTVFSAESAFQRVQDIGGGRLNGPGVADLKGGMLVMWAALQALESSPWAGRIGWEVLLTADEEIGSASSDPLLREAAARHHFGLIYEPALPDGALAGARKGSGNFDIVVSGRAAHAGRNPQDGRNAIRAAADLAAAIDGLNQQREGLTVNLGYVHGGGALNVVPARCVLKFNVRTGSADDEQWLLQQLDALLAQLNRRDGISAERFGGFTRPPKAFDASNQRLADMIAHCGADLGMALSFKPTGGCCDGNNLKAYGLSNIDNLGVVGADIHSDREWMQVDSLVSRAQLSALLLLRLASGEWSWSG